MCRFSYISFLDIFKMSNFHFLEKVSESEVFEKHVQSIMLSFGFFLEIFDCILFFYYFDAK